MIKLANLKYLPLLVFQLIIMALYFVFVRYGVKHHDIKGMSYTAYCFGIFLHLAEIAYSDKVACCTFFFFCFEGTHVMIFIGFGFLMTFLNKYCYSALGFNWLLASLVVQWALLCQSFYHMKNNIIYITKKRLLEADIMSATVLITFGAILGVASGLQLLFIAIVEVVIACFNFWIVEHIFKAQDVGGSIAIHAFGAYFGLGVSWALHVRKAETESETTSTEDLNEPSYMSDVTAMIGSIFLWVYWPSFNSGLINPYLHSEHQMAIVNTYLSLAAATVTTFVFSSLVSGEDGKFEMVHIQNSTLAGGVAVGSICNLLIGPGGAIAVGMSAGFISVMGYVFVTPFLTDLGIPDTCGVNNLHGMPGIYSGLLSALFFAIARKEDYMGEYVLDSDMIGIKQALKQLYAVLATVGIALVGGIITGFIARIPLFTPLKDHEKYDDEVNWELP